MVVYGLYKATTDGEDDHRRIVMSHVDVDILRNAANVYYAKPENFVGRIKQQLTIPNGQLISNFVTTDGGGRAVSVYIEIHSVDLPGLK